VYLVHDDGSTCHCPALRRSFFGPFGTSRTLSLF
jgi:hypothetical protein